MEVRIFAIKFTGIILCIRVREAGLMINENEKNIFDGTEKLDDEVDAVSAKNRYKEYASHVQFVEHTAEEEEKPLKECIVYDYKRRHESIVYDVRAVFKYEHQKWVAAEFQFIRYFSRCIKMELI